MDKVEKKARTNRYPPSGGLRRLGLGLALLASAGLAAFVYLLPYCRERMLAAASLAELQVEARRSPTDEHVWLHLAQRARRQGRNAIETEAWAKAAALDADSEAAWLGWADGVEQAGDTQRAFAILTLFLKTHPHSASAHLALAALCAGKQAHARAYDEAIQAADLTPANAEAWRLAGTQAQAMQRYREAEAAMQQALRRQPGEWRCHVGLGDALAEENRIAEAEAHYREAIRLAPAEAVPLLALGALLQRQSSEPGAGAQARAALEHAVALSPDNPSAYLLLAQCCEQQAQWSEASHALKQAQRLAPYSPEVAYEAARTAQRLGDRVRAKQEMARHQALLQIARRKRALLDQRELFPEKPALLLDLARLYAATGDYTQAADCYRLLMTKGQPTAATAEQELRKITLQGRPGL